MKTFILTGFLFFCCSISHAQLETANWFFGFNNGLTFTTTPPTLIAGSPMHTFEGTSSASDSLGNLLFYTNGETVWNKYHIVMPYGTGLLGHFSSSQSALVLPMPGSSTFYYIITAPEVFTTDPLAYSIVDMSLAGGLGSVTVKNVVLLDSSTEKLSAVRHQNGTDIWIVAHENGNANFHTYLLTSTGIAAIDVISTVGNAITDYNHKLGIIKIAPCGSFLAMTDHGMPGLINSTLELFDFDNATGQISNARLIANLANQMYGIEFSPNNQKLYQTFMNPGYVVQYDVTSGSAPAIIASADTIGQSTSQLAPLQLAPDGKIYVGKYMVQSLDCITSPNLAGNASAYVNNAVLLADSCVNGLPGFLTSYFCNIQSGLSQNELKEINLFPNPFNDRFTISSLPPNVSSIKMFDMFGHQVYNIMDIDGDELQIYPGNIADGIYLLELKTNKSSSQSKIMKFSF